MSAIAKSADAPSRTALPTGEAFCSGVAPAVCTRGTYSTEGA
jgi:hypothetical protein